jgi:hypothetical protein
MVKGQPRDVVQKALLNPKYSKDHSHRHGSWFVAIHKFTDALNESLKPRMNGEDLHA